MATISMLSVVAQLWCGSSSCWVGKRDIKSISICAVMQVGLWHLLFWAVALAAAVSTEQVVTGAAALATIGINGRKIIERLEYCCN